MARTLTLIDGNAEHQVEILEHDRVRVGERTFDVRKDGRGTVRISGERRLIAWTAAAGDVRWVFMDGRLFEFEAGRTEPRRRAESQHGTLTAPMPATVRRVCVAAGEHVARGDILVILEAMKMELPVRAGRSGRVTAVHCREGQLVQPGVTLIDLGHE